MSDNENQNKYLDIYLTDIQVHVQKMSNPAPLLKAVEKTVKTGKPAGRAYGKITGANEKDHTMNFVLPFDDKTQARIKEAQRQGKQIRIWTPKAGLFVFAGKDTVEKIEADKRKKSKRFDKLLRR